MSDTWLDALVGRDPATGPTAPVRLRELVAAAQSATSTGDATALIAAWLADDGAVEQSARALAEGAAEVESLVISLAAITGLKSPAGTLRTLVRKRARHLERGVKRSLAVAALGHWADASPSLGDAVGRADLPAGIVCPPGWRVDATGVTRLRLEQDDIVEVVVSRRPFLLSARFQDVRTGAVSVRVEWQAPVRWAHRVVARTCVMDRKEVVALSAFDFPVHSNNAADVVQFLVELEEVSRVDLPTARVSSTLGWQGKDGVDGFLWGRTHMVAGAPDACDGPVEDLAPAKWTPNRIHLMVEHGAGDLADGFRAGGTWEGWLAAIEMARPFPGVWPALYASIVPPIMRLVPTLPNFVVDLCGATSRGKTTSLRIAASVWGSPDEREGGLVRSWDNTRVWVERASAFLGALPLILDDTKRARRPEDVGRVLYDFANGIGRGRGNPDGMRDTGHWRSVLLSSGEAPATSFTQDGGTRARAICLWGSPFGDAQVPDVVRQIHAGVTRNFGHVGPRIVRRLLEDDALGSLVVESYDGHLVRWTKEAGNDSVAARAAQYVAALATAADLLHRMLLVPLPDGDPIGLVWRAVVQGASDSDRATDALRAVVSWSVQHQDRFFDSTAIPKPSPPIGGWLGARQCVRGERRLAILPESLRELLSKVGFETEAVLRTWDDRGWLARDGNHRTVQVQVGSEKTRCVVVLRVALDVADGGADV